MNTKRTTKDLIVRSAMTLILAVLATATVWGQNPASIGSISYNNSISAYEINSVANLNDLAVYVNGTGSYSTGTQESTSHNCSGMTFKMTADIACNSVNFTSIGIGTSIDGKTDYFCGKFDGEGHTISGICISGIYNVGLFGMIGDGAIIENITLTNTQITGDSDVGGIVGYNYCGNVTNCHVTSTVTITATGSTPQYQGGIVGENLGSNDGQKVGSISYCTSAATLPVAENVGAIAGINKDYCKLSHNLAIGATIPATNEKYYGAITGYNHDYGVLEYNYYSNCKIGSSSVTSSGVGCGSSTTPSDITDNDGAVSATILSESETVPSNLSGKVVFYREFTGGTASTICLPFAYTQNASDGTFYTFAGITTETSGGKTEYVATMVETNKAASLSANTPYLFKPAGTGIKPVLFHGTAAYNGNTSYTPQGSHWTFTGTYTGEQWTEAPTGIYGFSAQAVEAQSIYQGQFVKVGEYVKIRSLRAYLQYNGSSFPNTRGTLSEEELPDRILVRLVDSNGDITGIGELDMKTGEVTFDGNWYTLKGVRLSGKPNKRGIYVNNGRKYIIK